MARSIGMKLPKEFDTKVSIPGLDELIVFIEKRFEEDITQIQNLLQDGFYDFDSLALMYQPGSRVVAKNAGGGGVDMLCRVVWNRYEQGRTIMGKPMKYFQLCLEYVVAVGAHHATTAEVLEGFESFEGQRSLLGGLLQFIPLTAYSTSQQEVLLNRFKHRGKKYNDVAFAESYSYKLYQNGCFFMKGSGILTGSGNTASSGRIIIDTEAAHDMGHSLAVGNDNMVTGIKMKMKEYKLYLRNKAQYYDGQNTDTDDDNNMISIRWLYS